MECPIVPMTLAADTPDPPPLSPPSAALVRDGHWPHAGVLIVDDEPGMRSFLAKTLAQCVGRVEVAASAEEAEGLLCRQRFDLVVLDISLPGKTGIAWLQELRAQGVGCEVVLITAFADLETAIETLRTGASDFILKPFRLTQIANVVLQCLERALLKRENWVLRRALSQRTPAVDGLVGQSIVIQGLRAAIRRVAGVSSTVLLAGESGTGKELAALALHRNSPRSAAPFVPVNCATLSLEQIEAELFGQASGLRGPGTPGRDGLFVHAQGGTLFLDEIGELPAALRATLLRVLEERRIRPVGSEQEIPVDVRIVAATHRRLAEEVEAGRFRKDLHYRRQVVEIHLPSLRSHNEDIPELVDHFVAKLAPQLGVPAIEMTAGERGHLQQYDWPGNLRELRNLSERSLIVTALHQGLQRQVPLAQPRLSATTDLHTLEKQHILAVKASVEGRQDARRAAAGHLPADAGAALHRVGRRMRSRLELALKVYP
jgi:DNA-binding NtrC family response regulator